MWQRRQGPAQFTLPLGAPVMLLPKGEAFGAKRIFNAKPAAQPHTGSDYATQAGSPVLAAADGTLVVAQDLFFPGNAVFNDHGNGLVTMYFHLPDCRQGRAGGHQRPHSRHRGIDRPIHGTALVLRRALAQRQGVDPRFLLEAPAKIPSVNEASTPAGPHEGPTSGRVGHSGLGLAIVRHIVEPHGGTASAEGPGEGKGTAFAVTPAAEGGNVDRR